MNTINMSMDGIPELSGTTWYNKFNDKHFTIRDIINDGSQWMIQTTSGSMIPMSEMDNYIQSDKPVHNIPKVNPNMGKINIGNLDDTTPITQNENLQDPLEAPYMAEPKAPVRHVRSNNFDIIDKAMSKIQEPKVNVNIDWEYYPEREFELLQDIMGISKEDIASYIYTKWFESDIQDRIISAIKENLMI